MTLILEIKNLQTETDFSALLPRFNNTFFEMINHVNSEIFE